MPRQYLTPAEFTETPIGIAFATQGLIGQLGATVMDKLTFRASERADGLTGKRLGAPGNTTLSGPVSQNSLVLPVTSTLGYDNLAEIGVILGTGVTQEVILLQPGAVTITSYVTPYPGSLQLSTPTAFAHSSGEAVLGVYREVREAGTSSSSDSYVESLQSQAAQLALAHLSGNIGGLTRIVFTQNYPIIAIFFLEYAYSFDNAWNSLDIGSLAVESALGWYRLNLGSIVMPQGLTRTTYTAGYQNVPDDIKEAVSLLVADQIGMMINPFMATSYHLGKRSYTFALNRGRSPLEQRAMDILLPYRRFV